MIARIYGFIFTGTMALLIPFSAFSQNLEPKTLLYVGTGPCNNGEVTTFPGHKGCNTRPIGHTVDDVSAVPADNFIEVFSGNDVGNNKMVSPDSNHKGGSTESIGYLSKKPIKGGTKLYRGMGSCNLGEATISTGHKGCNSNQLLGYTLP